MKPLKASNDILPLDSPVYCWSQGIVSSPKVDGNRQLCICGDLCSSSMKTPRNDELLILLAPIIEFCQSRSLVLDYELWSPSQSHHASTSGDINSYNNPLPPDLGAYIFDVAPFDAWQDECRSVPYRDRMHQMETEVRPQLIHEDNPFVILPQRPVLSAEEAHALFILDLEDGYEGSMLRTLDIWWDGSRIRGGFYKHGRATNTQQTIWKQKLYVTLDGVITKVLQRRALREDWPRTRDSNGLLVRPLEKEAYTLTDMIGAFEVLVTREDNTTYLTEIGFRKGFDLEWRRQAWHQYLADPRTFIGRWAEFLHMPYGAMEGGAARGGGLTRFRDDLPRVTV